MPGFVTIVQAISNDVVAKLAAANYPALVDGAIVLGRAKGGENAAPPRIVFIPVGSSYEPKSVTQRGNILAATSTGAQVLTTTVLQPGQYASTPSVVFSGGGGSGASATAVMSGTGVAAIVMTNGGSGYTSAPAVSFSGGTPTTAAAAAAILAPSAEMIAMIQQRTICVEWIEFVVHCWGVNHTGTTITPDPALDFDGTQALAQQVIASAHLLAPGITRRKAGKWLTGNPRNTQVDILGQGYVFGLEIATPVLDSLLPIPGAGAGTQAGLTVYIQPADGSSREQAFP